MSRRPRHGGAAIRIISGTLKGHRLRTPDWPGLRPTSDRLRETLFNVLGQRLDGWRVLDGFAGTGAVGIEALSRGAAGVTFVEHDARAAALIAANLAHCGVTERYAIIRVDFARAAARLAGVRFDLVFLDPPYGADTLVPALEQADAIASEGTTVVIEHARRDAPPRQAGHLRLTRSVTSGDSALAFYQRREAIAQPDAGPDDASERSESATRTERAGEAASERACRGAGGGAKPSCE